MIKKAILERMAANQRQLADYAVGFDEAYTVGVIGSYHTTGASMAEMKKLLEADGKRVDVVQLADKPDKETIYPESTFFTSDVSLLGNIQSSGLQTFCDKPFDYLIVIDKRADALLKFIVSKSAAKRKVGYHVTELENLLSFMVQPSDATDSSQTIQDLYAYLKKIRNV